jgi:hypothetical protein
MRAVLLSLFILLTPVISFASQECSACMAECPHDTREMRACDRGCPKVCTKAQVTKIKKAQSCEACLAECPHKSREFRSCDGGCLKECDRDSLWEVLKKVKAEPASCREIPAD